MSWDTIAAQAVAQYTAKEPTNSGWRLIRRWRALRKRKQATDTSGATEPGYYVRSSDWPISRSDKDASPDETMQSLRGLSDYYETAMATLANDAADDAEDI
jgi:hypothetical protein